MKTRDFLMIDLPLSIIYGFGIYYLPESFKIVILGILGLVLLFLYILYKLAYLGIKIDENGVDRIRCILRATIQQQEIIENAYLLYLQNASVIKFHIKFNKVVKHNFYKNYKSAFIDKFDREPSKAFIWFVYYDLLTCLSIKSILMDNYRIEQEYGLDRSKETGENLTYKKYQNLIEEVNALSSQIDDRINQLDDHLKFILSLPEVVAECDKIRLMMDDCNNKIDQAKELRKILDACGTI